MKKLLIGILAACLAVLPINAQIVQFSGATPPAAWTPNATLFPNLAVAVAATQAGTSNTTILFVGDSTTASYGANMNGWVGAWPLSWPTQFAGLLNVKVNSSASSFFGDQNTVETSTNVNTYDSRRTTGAWTVDGTMPAASASIGSQQYFSTNSASTYGFTPGVTTDTVDFWYPTDPSFGSVAFNIGGGTVGTVNESVASSIAKQTISYTRGNQTLNFVSPASGTVYLTGMVAYDSTKKVVNVINGGWYGALPTDYVGASEPWSPLNAITAVAPNLTIISLTINPWAQGENTTQFTTETQELITAAKNVGSDVLLISGFPSDVSIAPIATQSTYIAIYASLASSNNVAFIDLTTVFGSWAAMNAAGETYDTAHPNSIGYGIAAQQVFNILQP